MKKILLPTLAFAACLTGLGATASAMTITPGNVPQTDDNVISASCDSPILGPALLIRGCLNGDHSFGIDFESDENILFDAGGQAKIIASDGAYDDLTISTASGDTFKTLILDIGANADGTVTFTGVPGGSLSFDLDGAGSNFFTITGEDFSSLSFTTTTSVVVDVKQVRIGGLADPNCPECPISTVPEPATIALLGSGLVGLIARKRLARKQ